MQGHAFHNNDMNIAISSRVKVLLSVPVEGPRLAPSL